jgi:septum formation protein
MCLTIMDLRNLSGARPLETAPCAGVGQQSSSEGRGLTAGASLVGMDAGADRTILSSFEGVDGAGRGGRSAGPTPPGTPTHGRTDGMKGMTPLLIPIDDMSTPTEPNAGHTSGAGSNSAEAAGGRVARLAPRLILASRSPRRRELLSAHGVTHEAEHPGIDDSHLEYSGSKTGSNPHHFVAALAYLKAAAGVDRARQRGESFGVVLGADTTCVVDGTIVGTPRDAAEARAMVKLFDSRTHDVLTGVALVDLETGRRELFVDHAKVTLGSLSDAQIDEYVANGGWQGKAGAYNLSERLAAGWPLTFEGDATSIMGLPMKALMPRLRRLGISGGV